MPYHFLIHEQIQESVSRSFVSYTYGAVYEYYKHSGPDVSHIDMMENRTGTYTSKADPSVEWIKTKPFLVERRVFLGWEYQRRSRVSYSRKSGQTTKRTHEYFVKRKVFDTVFDIHFKEWKLNVKAGRYVQANYLTYVQAMDAVFPRQGVALAVENRTGLGDHAVTAFTRVESTGSGIWAVRPNWESDEAGGFYYHGRLRLANPDSVSYPPGVTISPQEYDRLLSKLYGKVHDDLPNYYNIAAESGELLSTLRSLAKKALDLAWKLYKLQFGKIWKQLKGVKPNDFSKAYLTWIYGIAPVVSDIKKSIEIVSRESRCWRSFSTSIDLGSSTDLVPSLLDPTVTVEQRTTQFARMGVVIDGSMSVQKYLARFQNWQQVAGTAYEVIPFSFMLDWIVDISGYLNACTILEGAVIDSWLTTGRIVQVVEEGGFVAEPPTQQPSFGRVTTTLLSSSKHTHVFKTVRVERRRQNIEAMPVPVLPSSRNLFEGVSLQRGINALAVLVARTYSVPDRWSRSVKADSRKINLNLIGQR